MTFFVAYVEVEPFIEHGAWARGDFPGFEHFPPIPAKGQKRTFVTRSTSFKYDRLDDPLGLVFHWLPLVQVQLSGWLKVG